MWLIAEYKPVPKRTVVTNLFAKILKPRRNPARPGTPHAGPLGKTIAFREYVWGEGNGSKMTFEHADIYSGRRISLGKERVLCRAVLPYRLTRSSKSYSLYERIDS